VTRLGLLLVAAPVALFAYAYVGYPALLWLAARRRRPAAAPPSPAEWPMVTITVPAYNERHSIARTIEQLLALDYPADRRHIVVISDASTDGTDDVVAAFADRGVELLRLPARGGKTVAENAAWTRLRGDIVVNTDATTRILPGSLKPLVAAFGDPTVGAASGRDVSVGAAIAEGNGGEAGYVGYEMWVRSLETRLGSIVGVSGCFYGIRRALYDPDFPSALSRDFGCALSVRERGYRAVSVDEALCLVPRARTLQAEFRRKVRTMHRGLETLGHKRALLDPRRYGSFAWMLASHKLCRWLVPLTAPLALVGLGVLSVVSHPAAAVLLAIVLTGMALGAVGMGWPAGRHLPRILAIPAFLVASNVAGVLAWIQTARHTESPIWEPTRRPA
jgi:cellulose synthase/poly-beta-1,6-N-acetylglucosamine synthase-like glycosyltransferase